VRRETRMLAYEEEQKHRQLESAEIVRPRPTHSAHIVSAAADARMFKATKESEDIDVGLL
jgi:hypothetical protein